MSKSKVIPQMPWTARGFWDLNPKSLLVLVFGLVLFGLGDACLVLANVGSTPWTVLSQGLSQQLHIQLGVMTFIISGLALLSWIPIKIKPGIGTILNMIIIAWVLGAVVAMFDSPDSLMARLFLAVLGIFLVGLASAIYLTCHMGAGPRDGLMVGLCQVTRWRVSVVRTGIEVTVSLLGWLLGGTLGIGTVLFAVSVGWAMQISLNVLLKFFGNAKN
ncbi:YczE/YyaS/YitT family protein [Streptococcus thoraltensis]|uniref:membrane protein YczE n=1 Tax=Streptococcus thoraltensis TaxID=55085 RepID=UPI001F57E971|nr:YitT family protein [Streptococcus thoraltensis]